MNYIDMPVEQLKVYKPELTKKEDFCEFWRKTIKESEEQMLNSEAILTDYPVKQVKVYDVYYDGFKNSRIHAKLIMPDNASKENKVPVIVFFHGYNWNTNLVCSAFKYSLLGYAVLLAEARGQNIKSPDHNNYENGGAAGWLTLGIYNPYNYYYRFVYMDCVRAVRYLFERDDIDVKRIAVEGGSQGGGLSLAVGALCPDVKVVMADIPFLCHFKRAVLLSLEHPYLEIYDFFKMHDSLHKTEDEVYKTLSYFDNMNLCEWIKGDVLMSVGIEDNVCPPSTSFAVYNHIKSYKEIRIYPDWDHGGFVQQDEEKLKFITERFEK